MQNWLFVWVWSCWLSRHLTCFLLICADSFQWHKPIKPPLCSSATSASSPIMTLVISGKIPNCHCLCGLFQVSLSLSQTRKTVRGSNLPPSFAICCSMITEQLSWNNVIHENSLAVTTPLSHIILYSDDDKSQQSKTRKAGWYAR